MACVHIGETPNQPKHVLPCRHTFCLDCTHGIQGLMEGKLFSCPTCGNYSQYVDAVQTVGGRYGGEAPAEETAAGDDNTPGDDHTYYNAGQRDDSGTGRGPSRHNQGVAASGDHPYSADTDPQLRTLDGIPRDESSAGRGSLQHHHRQHNSASGHQSNPISNLRQCDPEPYMKTDADNGGVPRQDEEDIYTADEEQAKFPQNSSPDKSMEGSKTSSDYISQHGQGTQINRQQRERPEKCNEVPRNDINEETVQQLNIDRGFIFCEDHPNSEIYFYCETCDTPVCARCVGEKHKTHRTYSLLEGQVLGTEIVGTHGHPRCQTHDLDYNYYCKRCNKLLCSNCRSDDHKWCLPFPTSLRCARDDLTIAFDTLKARVRKGVAKYERDDQSTKREVDDLIKRAQNLKETIQVETKRAREKLDSNLAEMEALIDDEVRKNLDAHRERSQHILRLKEGMEEAEKQIINAQTLICGDDFPTAKLCADAVAEDLGCLERERRPAPLTPFDLQYSTNPIPGSSNHLAPVSLRTGRFRVTYTVMVPPFL